MPRYLKKLHVQIVVGFLLGALIGYFYPGIGVRLLPLAEGFVKLIKLTLAPIVFCFIVTGILQAGDLKTAGRVALKTLLYFEAVTTVALLIGVMTTRVMKPGVGLHVDVSHLDTHAVQSFVGNVSKVSDVKSFFLGIIPDTFAAPFANGDILQVIVLAVLFGCAVQYAGTSGRAVGAFIEQLSQIFFRIIGFVIRLSPLGVLGAMAFTVGQFGLRTIGELAQLILTYYVACAVFLALVLAGIMRLCGLSLWRFIKYFRSELLIAVGSGSSDAVMPVVMAKLRHLGIKDTTVGLVIPAGYTFNLDGFSIWLTCGTIFIAQATDTYLSNGMLALILGVSMLTSKGAHGIPGSATVVLAATLTVIPALPVLGIVLILSVDKLMGFIRVALNLIGNCIGAVVVGAWEKQLDVERARRVLAGDEQFESAIATELGAPTR